MKAPIERRRYARFQVLGLSAYVVLTNHWPGSAIRGDILDIGMGGVSFQYVAREEQAHNSSQLHILLTDGSLHLAGLPLDTVVSDSQMKSASPTGFVSRRCGVQFGALTHDQKCELRCFIQSHTTADPEA
jgi:c-di-GMP-binding flagellar brake protein YcgR